MDIRYYNLTIAILTLLYSFNDMYYISTKCLSIRKQIFLLFYRKHTIHDSPPVGPILYFKLTVSGNNIFDMILHRIMDPKLK